MSGDIRVAICGAGSRGTMFGELIGQRPEWARVVAIAEPKRELRERFAAEHGLAAASCYDDWRELLAADESLDAVVVTTMDREHAGPAITALQAGHHLLLEKPMAPTWEECEQIAHAAEEASGVTAVCHSMRYARPFRMLKEVVDSGRLGQVVTVDHIEQVNWWHQAHSFVRGKWGNEARSAFMLLAKSCHDIDYLSYLLGRRCKAVSSFGSLSYFTEANAPEGSGERCVDCAVEPDCPWSAMKLYVDADRENWPARTASPLDHSRQAHLDAVSHGDYGRCVWRCDNDVVDHQVVALEYEGAVTATFTMTGFTAVGGRRTRVHGTEGSAEFGEHGIEVGRYGQGAVERIAIEPDSGGHGGGDKRIADSWLRAIRFGDRDQVVSSVRESLATHRIVFAAEQARRERRVVELT